MTTIRNKAQLVANGETETDRKARMLALDCLEHALNAVDPRKLLLAKLQLNGDYLQVADFWFDLSEYQHIYVVGGGKAGSSMAQALEEILGNRITAGVVNVPYGSAKNTRIVELHEASHPVPDQAGVEGTQRMVSLAEKAQKDDLVVCLISGGGSSLMPLPREGITLQDKQQVTQTLLKSGATINEVNAVRKHLSLVKGGWLAKAAYPASVLNLVLSDVIGDPLDVIASGPTVPDSSAFADAKRVLQKYHLWENASPSVRKVLSDGEKGIIAETPKMGNPAFSKVYNVVVGDNYAASVAATEYLKAKGLNTLLLTTAIEGEAKHVGTVLAAIAREVAVSGHPVAKPAGIVAGGETTVTVAGHGKGGRNQELALSVAIKLGGSGACVFASVSTDGVDGPTDAAGAIVEGSTLKRANQLGLEPTRFLMENDSYSFFSKLGDLICTGQTGTNVNDISVIVVL